MARNSDGARPVSFYLRLAILADGLLIACLILLGGLDLRAGPLHLQLESLTGPVLLLFFLLAARRVAAGGEGGKRWQDAFFGPASSPTERWRAVEVLLLLSSVYFLFVGGAALARYRNLAEGNLTLATAAQAAWNSVEGRFLASSLAGQGGYLGSVFSPVMALVAQGYRLWPTPEFLLRVQSAALALGVWPVYLLAKRELGCRRWALVPAALFVLLPAVRELNLEGFHPLSLALTPLLFAFHLLREKPRAGGYLFAAAALACGEEAWPAVALLGLYICLVRKRWREGLFMALLGFYGYVFLVSFAMPRVAGVGPGAGVAQGALTALATRPVETLALLGEPGRAAYLRDLFVPLAFLPLLGPLELLFGLPLLAAALVVEPGAAGTGRAAETAILLPFLFAASIAGLGRLQGGKTLKGLKLLDRPLVRWAFVILPLASFGVSPAVHFREAPPEGYRKELGEVSALIPSEASLSTERRLAAHFAHREALRVLPATEGAEWIVLGTNFKNESSISTLNNEVIVELLSEKRFKVVHRGRAFVLLARSDLRRPRPPL